MARPIKTGLDYFPLDVVIDDDVELLEAECGLVGFAILIKLWQKIFSNGYFIEWNEDNAMLFARKINAELTLVNTVVNVCLRRDLFDKTTFNDYNVLTSKGIQKRYFKICNDAKRKGLVMTKEYQLINTELIGVNTELIALNPELSTQSKVKESKPKKINKSNSRFTPPTLEEVKAYCIERKNKVDAEKFIDFYESKGWMVGKNKMKSWEASVRTWEKKDSDKKSIKNSNNRFQNFEGELDKQDNKTIEERMKEQARKRNS